MKIFNKILFITGILVMANACSLKEDPYATLTSDKFFNTESEAISALAYCYDNLTYNEYYGRYFYYIGTLGTEEYTLKPDAGADDHEMDKWTVSTTNGNLTANFFFCYMGVNRANTLLAKVPGINGMNDDVKNQILGEGHFLRALHYFNLVRTFGEVPLRKESVVSADQMHAPLATLSEIYSFIIEDLTAAESLMDEQLRDGRANKVAAQGLLAQVHLQLASAKQYGVPKYEFVSSSEEHYQKAAEYSSKVLNNNSGYSFWSKDKSLQALWGVNNQVGNEFIFSVAYGLTGAIDEGDYSKLAKLMIPYVNGGKIRYGNNFEIATADGWNHLQATGPFYTSLPEDKRKTELIVTRVKLGDSGDNEATYPGNLNHPFTLKFVDTKMQTDQSEHYIPVIRFSEIALIYAEAVGPTEEGYQWINAIRERAGAAPLAPGLSVEEFRNAVLEERRVELAFEGYRLFDLRRTKRIQSVLNGQYGLNVTDADVPAYFYPIPQRERDLNNQID